MMNLKLAHSETHPKSQMVMIDADKAIKMLEQNTNNRPLNEWHVQNLAAQMVSGAWKFNGDAIRMDVDGRILDGQHRLWAIVNSNTKHRMLVITGLDREVFSTIDTGRKRGARDVLAIAGYVNGNQLGAVARLVAVSGLSSDWNGHRRYADRTVPTNDEILRTVEQNPRLVDAVRRVGTSDFKLVSKYTTKTIVGFVYYWLTEIDFDEAEEFFARLEYAENLSRKDPESLFRKRVMESSDVRSKTSLGVHRVKMALMFKAWNMRREGKKGTLLRWTPSERFPTPL